MNPSSGRIRLSVDMMGGDRGLDSTVPGILEALKRFPDLSLHLVGDESRLRTAIGTQEFSDRVSFIASTEVVEMDESPAQALRSKKDSSMRVAVNLLAEGIVDGCVSAGNTGALMATARFVLKMLPGIDRPAIIATLPRASGHVYVLDLGANVDSSPEILLQFALMGESMVRTLEGKQSPTVGLLNVGSEEIKGSGTIKKASELLRESKVNYVGYVEGDDIFNGSVDIIVCDGFEGNIALKTSEGLAQMLSKVIREEFTRGLLRRCAALVAAPVLRSVRARIDHRQYNGAVLLGLKGAVVKSHGSADGHSFANAINAARIAVIKGMVQHIQEDFSSSGMAPVQSQ